MRKYDRPLPPDIDARLQRAAKMLGADPRVLFAYVFGGYGRGKPTPLSDVDVAIYLDEGVEVAPAKLDLLGMLIDGLGTDDVDLVILNEAPLSLSGRIQQSARVLIDKVPSRRCVYESVTRRAFADFQTQERAMLFRRFGLGG